MNTDVELVNLLKEGDEKAFELVFNTYFEKLCLFSASITQDYSASEEIVEELLLQVWLNCQINPIETSVKSYLFRSVYNNSIKYTSRNKHTIFLDDYRFSEKNIFEPFTPAYPIAYLIEKELEDKARRVIDTLPEQCRKIYTLNRDEGLKYHEIAQRLNISVGTVKTQMSRAFGKLREELEEFL